MNYLKTHRLELGIVLANTGTQISRLIIEVTRTSIDMTNVIFLLSLLLVFDFGIISHMKILKPSRYMILILIYNVYALFNAFVTGVPMKGSAGAVIFTLYVICFWLSVCTNRKPIDGKYLVNAMWWISAIGSLVLMYVITNGFRKMSGTTFIWLEGGSDRLTMSVIAFICLCTGIVYKPGNQFSAICKYLLMAVAFYDLMSCSRRGLLVTLIIIVAIQLVKTGVHQKISFKSVIHVLAIVAIIPLVVAVIIDLIPGFREMFLGYVDRLLRGVSTYFGDMRYGIDQAAVNRTNNISQVSREYLKGTMKTIFLGKGYNFRQLDVPYLQAFVDLGLFGGIIYFIITGIYPIKLIFKKLEDEGVILLQYLSVMYIAYNLYSGVPYGHYKFVGLIALAYGVDRFQAKQRQVSLRTDVTKQSPVLKVQNRKKWIYRSGI